jgi:hypothetical protein
MGAAMTTRTDRRRPRRIARTLAGLAYPAVVLLAAAVLVGCAACAAVSVGWEEFARRVGPAGRTTR